ncbi:radical SAM family heme chaperone HemW [Acutalibacter sp. LFL-21]|uniref:radical SAM family heme chaperone HemW n=1 Tax=Acutalibacter sp. LFL-21 TaxID=2983399 RepID=UPI0021D64D7D|nr:radical SAM family heme chaperone HemW [Acutalibacter sp. LFL-21]MCU7651576.1 radical SAM family heme chaperone HemW [Acutalibacter sp. LFL-21]
MLGFYIHVPFCHGKCPYCDFYSRPDSAGGMDAYVSAVIAALAPWRERLAGRELATVYFGGGTPSLLGAQRLGTILQAVRQGFSLASGAEVTLEANPTHVDRAFFQEARRAGFNRLSMGLQSANGEELRFLGRAHSPQQAALAVENARAGGFENISLDLMLGLPGGSREKLGRSIAFAASLEVEHISSYILKVEPGTPFAARGVQVPDEDDTAEQYLFAVEELARRGYGQYEISNFARPGKESRHNLLYWRGEEYLGFGPGAHSFFGGRRFYYPRDLEGFLQGNSPVEDGTGGDFGEFAMLNLRLTRGLRRGDCLARFGAEGGALFDEALENARHCPPQLLRADGEAISFTPEGFLVSNALLVKLLGEEL